MAIKNKGGLTVSMVIVTPRMVVLRIEVEEWTVQRREEASAIIGMNGHDVPKCWVNQEIRAGETFCMRRRATDSKTSVSLGKGAVP